MAYAVLKRSMKTAFAEYIDNVFSGNESSDAVDIFRDAAADLQGADNVTTLVD